MCSSMKAHENHALGANNNVRPGHTGEVRPAGCLQSVIHRFHMTTEVIVCMHVCMNVCRAQIQLDSQVRGEPHSLSKAFGTSAGFSITCA